MESRFGAAGYAISTADHIERIEYLLTEGTVADLLYAALELRLGAEARQAHYAEHWDHIPKKVKQAWSLSELGRGLARAFNLGDVVLVLIQHYEGVPPIVSRYTPITKRLLKICDELGNYLHSRGWQRQYFAGDGQSEAWCRDLHGLVVEGLAHLKFSASGNMAGPALKRGDTNQVSVISTYPEEIMEQMRTLAAKGTALQIEVRHEAVQDVIQPIYQSALDLYPYKQ